ncbi:flagellar brake protein [Paramaledivibacter caminithermalis]|uniref:C-di-GMP-binding flagellar brake protein YcgR, contains PilZNR and PilZ domains n=1 Tax=Paramaledivibacter caminithermalis (strain DSM 15212 / CIP 107654 / DViRD3) TaxID=1121301 RepID=A0A1M6N6S9_PARC5|nr:PilZ domain-containing protein [Paramaledivibacter caminithermalis]SHJ91353.1 c-di-GMP-binding flagellar brake protein YcgR, contains PilZNR and PilZ domains [Paramaledivibacter caminithermalis DSM 15212]
MDKRITDLLDIGENIEIEIEKDDSFLNLKSNVIRVINDNIIVISNPIYKGRIYPMRIGTNINIVFNKENKGQFYYVGEIIDRKKKNNLNILFVSKHSDIRHFQRREFYRLNIVLNVDLQIIENGAVVKTIPAITKDISGGGVRLIAKSKLEKYTTVKCVIHLDNETIEAFGKVLRCDPIPDSMLKYDLGICYTAIEEKSRSKIISFVFKRQRKMIKKGLM